MRKNEKLRIVMYAANLRHWGALDPKALFEDVPSPAGTEIAMMGVARSLAARGHRVTVFASCDGGTYDGVDYITPDLALPLLSTLESDVVVSWQDPSVFLYPIKTKLRILMSQSTQLGLGQTAERVDRYFSISKFSAETLLDGDPYADPSKMWITRNGIALERFHHFNRNGTLRYEPDKSERPHSLAWLSSPDRGLHHLVQIFEKVRAVVPDATFDVLYDFDRAYESYKNNMPGSAYVRWLDEAAKLKGMPGVRVLNHLSQPNVAELLSRTAVVAYPCDPVRATETYCISMTEAMAAGCAVVISDADCLPENYANAATILPRPIDHDAWAAEIIKLMTDEEYREGQMQKGLKLASTATFDEIAWEWESFFESYLDGGEIFPDMSLSARLVREFPKVTNTSGALEGVTA
jgi:glycosyltransferase involved in cell wall biosynthesis